MNPKLTDGDGLEGGGYDGQGMGDLIRTLYPQLCKMTGVLEECKLNVIINIKGFDCAIFFKEEKVVPI